MISVYDAVIWSIKFWNIFIFITLYSIDPFPTYFIKVNIIVIICGLFFFKKSRTPCTTVGLTASNNTCDLKLSFFLRHTWTMPLSSIPLGSTMQMLSAFIETLQIAPLIFGRWSLGIIVTFLKSKRFEIMIFSSFRISRNALSNANCKLLHTACARTVPLSNFLWHVKQTYCFPSELQTL